VIYTLRTEGGSRGQEAWAIGLGLAVGFSPFIGLHLGMCIALGWLFGLNRLKLYLAANLVNPLIMPGVLFLEVQLGSWLRRGDTYALSMDAFSLLDPWHFGLDILLGGMVLSIIGGLIGGVVTYAALGRRYRDPGFSRLMAVAADRYLGTSLTAWEFARAKLRGDPVYRAVLASGWLPASGVLVDVGCGPGLLLALIAEAAEETHEGRWPPDGWPAAPADLRLHGIEVRPRAADLARYALGDSADIQTADAREARLPAAIDLAVMFDVLHLVDRPSQGALVARVAAAMPPGAILLVREADAAAGWRFGLVRLGNTITALMRGRWRPQFAFRTAAEWQAELSGLGFDVSVAPMGDGTPFANVLLVARRVAMPQSATAT
jgi:SAM-dependent methyltransferase